MDLAFAIVAVIVALAATATVRIMRAESERPRKPALREVTITDGEVEEIGGAR